MTVPDKSSPPSRAAAPPGRGAAPPADFDEWHPKLQRLFRYWQSIHPPHGLPGRQHLDPIALGDLLPGMWLLDVQREPFRLRYRLVGTRIVEAIGHETTGQWLDEAHPHVIRKPDYFDRYRGVIATKAPSRRRGPARLWTNQDYREIENVVLPLATDGTSVDVLAVLTVMYRLDGTSL
jgi:hypothetical protein